MAIAIYAPYHRYLARSKYVIEMQLLRNTILLVLSMITVVFFGCNNPNINKLRKLEIQELLERINNMEVNLLEISYRDSVGNELSKELRKKLNEGQLFRDFYANEKNEITQIRLKNYSHEHVFDEIRIRELLSQPLKTIKLRNVNCSKSDSILKQAFEDDQEIRHGGEGSMAQVDSINQQTVISFIEKCKWPKDPDLIKYIWYVLQHADSGYMSYYYAKFKQLEKDSLLKSSTMALMEDRMLMNNGYPQIYGSQMVRNNVYKLRDAENVNELRASVGLGPIEEQTEKFGFEYNN